MTLYLEVRDGGGIKAYTYADALGYDLVGPFFVVRRMTEDLFIPVANIEKVKVVHGSHVSH